MTPDELVEKARNELSRASALPGLLALNLFDITTPKDADDLTIAVLVPRFPRKFKRISFCWDEDDILMAYTISGQSYIRVVPSMEEAKKYLLDLFWDRLPNA